MKLSFNKYLEQEIFESLIASLHEETLLNILAVLKKKITALLKEDENSNQDVLRYLKIVAIFEQLFRYVNAKKINLLEIPGFKGILDKNDIERANEKSIENEVDKIIQKYFESRLVGFKNVVNRRFDDFAKWLYSKDKNDLKIVNDAIDFTIKSIEKFNHDARTS